MPTPVRIGYICPIYKADEFQEYTLRALRSFFRTTADGVALVLDDASPGWNKSIESHIERTPAFPSQRCVIHRFSQWGGLTRSWNKGLYLARNAGCTHICVSNNDVLFSRNWYDGLLQALAQGYHLVGPVSNAPGVTAGGKAEVWRYDREYAVSDDPQLIDDCAKRLKKQPTVAAPVNGFCMFSRTDLWFSGAYDKLHVFRPSNEFNSRGQRNPTPLMTLNEDELQHRWRKMGRCTAVVPSSFVFHYRAVSRGRRYVRGRWHRISDKRTAR